MAMPPPAAATRWRTRRGRARKAPTFHVWDFHYLPEPWEPWERDWADLPADAISCVLHKLSLRELLLGGVAEVCRSWRRAARQEPELWRHIDVRYMPAVPPFTPRATRYNMMLVALRLSAGQCHTFLGEDIDNDLFLLLVKKAPSLKRLDISGYYHISNGGFPNAVRKLPLLETFHGQRIGHDLFMFLVEQAPSLKRVHLIGCYHIFNGGFANTIKKLPLLEVLTLENCYPNEEVLELVAKVCRCLKHFSLVHQGYRCNSNRIKRDVDDRKAFAISRMHGLRSLKLLGDYLGNEGLKAIIQNCTQLEYLKVRDCDNINMDANLREKCAQIIMDYYEYFPPTSPCSCCSSPTSWFSDYDYDYDPDDYHDLSLYSYLGDDIDGADFEEYERILDVKSMRRYLS